MNIKRIEEIQKETAYPDSISVQQALLKVWNECEQERAVKNNSVLPLVINQRELLISFLTWVREDYREDISIEYLVDYWLDKRNQ